MSAFLLEVIVVEVSKGEGIEGDPVRRVTQFWSKEGVFLSDDDKYEWTPRASRIDKKP